MAKKNISSQRRRKRKKYLEIENILFVVEKEEEEIYLEKENIWPVEEKEKEDGKVGQLVRKQFTK